MDSLEKVIRDMEEDEATYRSIDEDCVADNFELFITRLKALRELTDKQQEDEN